MPHARYTHTRLLVSDFPASFHFYRDILNFPVHLGDEAGPYAEFHTHAGHILALFHRPLMAAALEEHWPAPAAGQDRAVLCLAVDNVDTAFEELKRLGAKVVAPPADRPDWMIRTAHFRDPDNHLIEINHPL